MKNKFFKMTLALLVAVGLVTTVAVVAPTDSDASTNVTLPTVVICSHTYVEKIKDKYLKEARNFEHGDIYYKSCSKCGTKITTLTFEDGSPYIYGDVNDDETIDDTDMLLLIQYIANYDWDTDTSSVVLGPVEE